MTAKIIDFEECRACRRRAARRLVFDPFFALRWWLSWWGIRL